MKRDVFSAERARENHFSAHFSQRKRIFSAKINRKIRLPRQVKGNQAKQARNTRRTQARANKTYNSPNLVWKMHSSSTIVCKENGVFQPIWKKSLVKTSTSKHKKLSLSTSLCYDQASAVRDSILSVQSFENHSQAWKSFFRSWEKCIFQHNEPHESHFSSVLPTTKSIFLKIRASKKSRNHKKIHFPTIKQHENTLSFADKRIQTQEELACYKSLLWPRQRSDKLCMVNKRLWKSRSHPRKSFFRSAG
jgi:hypothetical protein